MVLSPDAEMNRLFGHMGNVYVISADDATRDEILRKSCALILPSVSRAEAFGVVLLEGLDKAFLQFLLS